MGEDDVYRPVSIWRPIAPDGYCILGDVAQTGYEPPKTPVATYLASDVIPHIHFVYPRVLGAWTLLFTAL